MISTTIHQAINHKQDTKDGIFTMKGFSLTRLIHSLIREYGTYHDGSYEVDPSSISLSDKKLILSHVTDSEEYELACTHPVRTETLFNEYIDHIHILFDQECDEVYSEDMNEAGLIKYTHDDNGEQNWVGR